MLRYIIASFLMLGGCAGFVKEDPVLTINDGNVLRPQVTFSTHDSLSVFIEYWREGSSFVQKSKISNGRNHRLNLLNLSEKSSYNYAIHSVADGKRSRLFSFKTGEIPESIFQVTKELIDTTVFSGYLLIRKFGNDGADIIINNSGDIVWYHQYQSEIRRQFTWTQQNTILSGLDTARIAELNLFGDRLLDLDLSVSEHPLFLHHEILNLGNDQFVSLITDSIQIDNDRFAYTDGIARFSKDGTILWKWSVSDHIDLKKATKSIIGKRGRVSHSNSLAVDRDNGYLVSFRDFAQVWKVNSTAGSVEWKLGRGGTLKMDTALYFIGQHSISKIGNTLVIFDNGHPRLRPFSRIVGFVIDEKNGEAVTNIVINLPKEITSYRMGSAYPVGNGNFLVCTSTKPLLLSVVNKEGKIVWQIRGNQNSYRAYYIENPF